MSKKYDPSQYETVKERKERFYQKYKDGRIVVNLADTDYMEYVIVHASVYISGQDQAQQLPRGTGYALEVRDKELKVSNYGKEYESVNYTSWLENCEESAIGRALDNAGFSGNRKCSLEEMEKTVRNATAIKSKLNTPKISTQTIEEYTTFRFKGGKQANKTFPEITDTGWLKWAAENMDDTKKSFAARRLKELEESSKNGLTVWGRENDAPLSVPYVTNDQL